VVIFIASIILGGRSPRSGGATLKKALFFITFVKFGLMNSIVRQKIVFRADYHRHGGLAQILPQEYFQYFCGFFERPLVTNFAVAVFSYCIVLRVINLF